MAEDGFPEVVRRYMNERGTGTRALARMLHHDPGYLSKILNGVKPCGAALARRIDEALDARGAVIAAAARPVPVSLSGRPVAPELAGYFSSQLAGHYTADRFLGPRRLIPVALSQYGLLCEVANDARGALREELWSVAAGYAALLGWLYQDAGEPARSARWHDEMIERAHRSHDVQLVAFSLHCKAMLLGDAGDGPGVLDLAMAGLAQEGRLCPKARVLLLQQAAHGTSLSGHAGAGAECARLLDQAAALVDSVDDGYPWGGNCVMPRYVDVQRATIATRLGDPGAVDAWAQVLPGIPAQARRDLGVYRARQARALAAAGEPEQAAVIAAEVVPLAASTGSARMRTELGRLRQAMRPWKNEPPGRALEEALAGMRR